MVAVSIAEMTKLLSQLETVRQVLGRHEVLSSFDTRMQIANLSSKLLLVCTVIIINKAHKIRS